MKHIKTILAAATLSMLGLAPAALADGDKDKLVLPFDCELDGVKLEQGKYTIRWQGESSSLTVEVLDGKDVLVKTSATRSEVQMRQDDRYVRRMALDNGRSVLVEVRPQGRDFALRFEEALAKLESTGGIAKR